MKTIALFVYDPKCSVQSCNGIMNALNGHYNFKIFSKNEVEYDFFYNVDMVAVPGGSGIVKAFIRCLNTMQKESSNLSVRVASILASVWGLTGLVVIILIC